MPAGVGTARYGCGLRTQENTSARSLGIRVGSQACRSVQMVLPLLVGVGLAPCCCGNNPPTPTEEVNRDNVLNPHCERIWEYNSTIFPIACGLSPLLYLLPLFHPIPYSVNSQFLRALPANLAFVGTTRPARHIPPNNCCFCAEGLPSDMIGRTKDCYRSDIQSRSDVHGS